MFKSTIILIVLNCIVRTSCFVFPNNPCPSIFSYIYNGKEFLGYITVPAPYPSANIAEISANFSIEGIITKYGPIKLDEYDKAIDKIRNGQLLKFVITLPKSNYLPTVTQITYNGNVLCAGPPVSAPTRSTFWLQYTFNWSGVISPQNNYIYYTIPPPTVIYQPTPHHVPYFPPKQTTYQPPVTPPVYTSPQKETTTKPNVLKPNKFTNYRECGIIRKKRSADDDDYAKRIINGTVIPPNEHPWLAALFDTTLGNAGFFCAGSLISSKHVITAAHCTIRKNKMNIQVRLGVHDTSQIFQNGVQPKMVKTVMQHPEYISGKAHADMSFLVLSNEVTFTDAVKPICLWNYDANFAGIIGSSGTIMGWGRNEYGAPSTIPMKTVVTISTKQKCKEIDLLKNLVTDQTFCAGRKGTGPCMGDSGGGLFLALDGKWYLRGIISTSIADKSTQICDTSTYSIYVDTAKYMNWIVDNMEYN